MGPPLQPLEHLAGKTMIGRGLVAGLAHAERHAVPLRLRDSLDVAVARPAEFTHFGGRGAAEKAADALTDIVARADTG